MKKPYKPSIRQIYVSLMKYKQRFDYKDGILFVLAFTIVTVMTIFMSSGNPRTYVVKVGDKIIGYISNYEIYEKAVDSVRKVNNQVNLDSVTAEKTGNVPVNAKMLVADGISKVVSVELGLKVPCVELYANGQKLGVLADQAAVDKVLDGVIKSYYPKVQNGKIIITSSKIAEKTTTKQILADSTKIEKIDDVIKRIIAGKGEQKKYVIKNGDTIWDIALSHDVSIEEIKTANPKMNLDKIKIGQVVNLAVYMPYMNVRITAMIDSKETIPYETKTVTDKKIRKGLKKIKSRGKNGLAQIKKNAVIENGNLVSEDLTSTKTLVAAVDAVVIVGGKTQMYLATGDFMKPARGRLTSTFGRRWGRMHQGIDLAGPTGTPVKAADSGKVTFVGWNAGYGRCVMISHGNRVQTLYGHNSRTYVKVGQSVQKGQRIAAIGSTGRSTGPHVHFEIRKGGVPVNPLKYIN